MSDQDTLYQIESFKSADSLPREGAFTVYEAVLVPVEPIDVDELIADLYGCLTSPRMGGDLDAKCVRSILEEYGIGGDK